MGKQQAPVPHTEYRSYINSGKWRARRKRFIRAGYATRCWGCGKSWGHGDHIHHQTYARLGAERDEDLVPLCEPCHDKVHELFEQPKVKRRGLRYATSLVVDPKYVVVPDGAPKPSRPGKPNRRKRRSGPKKLPSTKGLSHKALAELVCPVPK